ncbi:MAG TPA: hypothetical protein VGS58_12930, partial [Candidatus Sulfopaludibacter sp.]|nr:hypothetical protein [Candidatus Sulfopaludibacter sp.]
MAISDLPGAGSVYAGRGWIELVIRGTAPSQVLVWERGIPELDLFLESDHAAAQQPCAASPRGILVVPVIPK